MSKIQVNEIVNHFDTGAPDCPKGLTVTGFSTFTGSSSFSGDVSIGGSSSFSGDVSIGGTLTYEDVTNIDSVGIITARNGIKVTTGDIEVASGNIHVAGAGSTIGVATAYIESINDLGFPSAGPLSNRNIVKNGAMQVAQRGNTTSNITSGTTYPTADLFRTDVSMGTWTSDRMTNSQGDTYESGSTERFRNSLRLTCTTGQASPGATDNVKIVYFIEGQDAQHLDYGTTNAKTMTLSFWVKSSKTGTGTVELIQEDNSDRQFSASYTIYATNTWEQKVITIPGDSSGVINNDNGRGLDIIWWLNSGSTFTGGSQGGWRALVNNNRNSDNLAIGSADNDEWFLTGVQLEIGTRATPFEHRSYSDTLALCQRYYYDSQSSTSYNSAYLGFGMTENRIAANVRFPVPMRAPATSGITMIRPSDSAEDGAHRFKAVAGSNTDAINVSFTSISALDVGDYGFPYWNVNAATVSSGYLFHVRVTAEL